MKTVRCLKCGRAPRKKDKHEEWTRPGKHDSPINICPECHETFLYAIARFKQRLKEGK